MLVVSAYRDIEPGTAAAVVLALVEVLHRVATWL